MTRRLLEDFCTILSWSRLSFRQGAGLIPLGSYDISVGSAMNSWPGKMDVLTHLLRLAILVSCFSFEVAQPSNILPSMVVITPSLSITFTNMPVLLSKSESLTYNKETAARIQPCPKASWVNIESSGVSVKLCSLTTHIIKEMLFLLLFNSVKSKCSQYVKQLLISGVCQIFTATKLRSKWTMILTGSVRLESYFFLVLF